MPSWKGNGSPPQPGQLRISGNFIGSSTSQHVYFARNTVSVYSVKNPRQRTSRTISVVGRHANVWLGLCGGLCRVITLQHHFDAAQPSHGSRSGTPCVMGNVWLHVGQTRPPSTTSSPSARSTASSNAAFDVGHTRISTRLFFMGLERSRS